MKSKQVQEFKETEIGKVPVSWTVEEIQDLLDEQGYIRGPFGSSLRRAELKSEGIPVYEQQHIIDNHRNFRFFIDDEKYQEMSRFTVKENDILISCSGTVGETTIISKDDPKGIISQAILTLRVNPKKILSKFLQYFLRSKKGRDSIISVSSGSVQVNIARREIIQSIKIGLPSIPEQQDIINILDALDSKIQNLQDQNRILEQTAQAIFKSWFVDFDGVTEFEDSELGKIPKEWSVGNLEDICEITMGQSPPGSTYNENGNGIFFFQGNTDFGDFFPTPRVYCTSPKKFAEKNDVLFTVRAPIGSINIAKERCCIGRGLASLRLKNNHGSFLYYLLKNSFDEWQKFDADGTIFGAVKRENVCDFKIITPDTNTIISFNKFIDPFYNNIWKNNERIPILTKIRDALLPKLMSGEIRV